MLKQCTQTTGIPLCFPSKRGWWEGEVFRDDVVWCEREMVCLETMLSGVRGKPGTAVFQNCGSSLIDK